MLSCLRGAWLRLMTFLLVVFSPHSLTWQQNLNSKFLYMHHLFTLHTQHLSHCHFSLHWLVNFCWLYWKLTNFAHKHCTEETTKCSFFLSLYNILSHSIVSVVYSIVLYFWVFYHGSGLWGGFTEQLWWRNSNKAPARVQEDYSFYAWPCGLFLTSFSQKLSSVAHSSWSHLSNSSTLPLLAYGYASVLYKFNSLSPQFVLG